MNTVRMFDLSFSGSSLSHAAETLSNIACTKGKKLAFTPNVDHLVQIETNAVFSKAYQSADFIFADGMPIVWFSRLIGRALPERVTGADLVSGLCELAAKKGLKIFMLGGAPEVTLKAARKLQQQFPSLNIAGISTPPLNFENDDEGNRLIIASINQISPDILFVALGAPRQEVWSYRNRERLDVGLILGVGGAFDFIAGRLKRAPVWVQSSGLEWLWRLFLEPKRLWKRYLVRDVRFIGIVFREWWKQQSGHSGTS